MSNGNKYARMGNEHTGATTTALTCGARGLRWAMVSVAVLTAAVAVATMGVAAANNVAMSSVPGFIARQDYPCSSRYGASFGTPGQVQGFTSTVATDLKAFMDHQVNALGLAGGYVAGAAGASDEHHYEAGYANVTAETLFTNTTIVRLLSQTKFIGTVAFLKFMSESNINGDMRLSSVLPAYADATVIQVYTPVTPLIVSSGVSTTINSNRITIVTASAHGLTSLDNVTVAGALSAVGGVPADQINGVHIVKVASATSFSYSVNTVATSTVSSSGGQLALQLRAFHLATPFSMTASSATITVTSLASHGFATGDRIGIHMASFATLNGVPAAEINAVHTITVTSTTAFTFAVTTVATATLSGIGSTTRFALLAAGVYQTTLSVDCDALALTKVRYYTLIAANPPILVRHILEHSLGWTYGTVAGLLCTPFVATGSTPYEETGAIQSQIAKSLNLALFADMPGTATAGGNISSWATSWAALPLMFHPGESFSYGPQLSLLGAIIETADASTDFSLDTPPRARTLGEYMNETLFTPLGMVDTMFFIQDDDDRRVDLLSRMSEVYLTQTSVAVADAVPELAAAVDWAYAAGRPRGTEMIDTGLLSTPADLMRFYKMIRRGGTLANGTRIVPATLLAEASRTQNLFFNGGVGGYSSGLLQRGRQATWGYGTAVSSQAHPFQSTSAPMGSRSISWIGAYNTAWTVDFGQNTLMFTGIQGLGAWPELFRMTTRYNECLRCIDPVDVDLPSKLV